MASFALLLAPACSGPSLWSDIPVPPAEEVEGLRFDYIDLETGDGQIWQARSLSADRELALERADYQNLVAGDPEPSAFRGSDLLMLPLGEERWLAGAFPGLEVESVEPSSVPWGWETHEGVLVAGTLEGKVFRAEIASGVPGIGLARYTLGDPEGENRARFELASSSREVRRDAGDGWVYEGVRARMLFEDPDCWALHRLLLGAVKARELPPLPIHRDLVARGEKATHSLDWGREGGLLGAEGHFDALAHDPMTGRSEAISTDMELAGFRVAKKESNFDRSSSDYRVEWWWDRGEERGKAISHAILDVSCGAERRDFRIEGWRVRLRDADEPFDVVDGMWTRAAEEQVRAFYETLFAEGQAITKENLDSFGDLASERLWKMPDYGERPHFAPFQVNPMTGFPEDRAEDFEVEPGTMVEKKHFSRNDSTRRSFEVPVVVRTGGGKKKIVVRLTSSTGSDNPDFWWPEVDDFVLPGDQPTFLDRFR